MMYETAILLKANHSEEAIENVKSMMSGVISENGGEILLEDDWGIRSFPWPLAKGTDKGRYLYFLFESGPLANKELERKFNIDEEVLRSLIVKLGPKSKNEHLVKNYKSPFAS